MDLNNSAYPQGEGEYTTDRKEGTVNYKTSTEDLAVAQEPADVYKKPWQENNSSDFLIKSIKENYTDSFLPRSNWKLNEVYSGKILDFDTTSVKVEILIDKEEKLYQVRYFSRIIFQECDFLDHGNFIQVKIYNKPKETKITIEDGRNIVPKSDFPKENILDEIKDFKMFKFRK